MKCDMDKKHIHLVFIIAVKCIFTAHVCCHKNSGVIINFNTMKLTSVPTNIPNTTTELNLGANLIKIISRRSFLVLVKLQRLILANNKINYIENGSFSRLLSLAFLDLSGNELTTGSFSRGLFHNLMKLNELIFNWNLNGGNFSLYEQALSLSTSLKRLTMELPYNKKFSTQICRLTNLKELHLEGFSRIFKRSAFKNLKCLRLESLYLGEIESIESGALDFFPYLKTLFITIHNMNSAHNIMNNIFQSIRAFAGRNMTEISIKGNTMRNSFMLGHSHFTVLGKICLKQLRLVSDSITHILARPLQLYALKDKCLEVLYLTQVTSGVDVTMSGFCNFKKLRVLDISHSRLNLRLKRWSEDRSLSICLPPNLVEFNYYDTKKTRARNYQKWTFLQGKHLKMLNVANHSMRPCNITVQGLENLETLDISGWDCVLISTNLFSQFSKLKKAIAKDASLGVGIPRMENASKLFELNTNLQYIDMSNNGISDLPKNVFTHPFNIPISVDLGRNTLKRFPKFLLKPDTVKIVILINNKITSFEEPEMSEIDIIKPHSILLRGNPLECSCSTIDFLKWLKRTNVVSDINKTECVFQNGTVGNIGKVLMGLQMFEIECQSKFWMEIAVSSLLVVILILGLSVVYYRYRYAFEYFFLRIKMKFKQYEPIKKQYTFDAFISYSHKDIEWVKLLHDRLDNNGFKICIDEKDFLAGNGIAENVVEAIDSSRKVIFIITENFLESSWGTYEIEMTRMHAFRNGRDSMVIVIIKDDIDRDKLPKQLKEMWYKIVCIVWPTDTRQAYNTETKFYQKVQYFVQFMSPDNQLSLHQKHATTVFPLIST